MAQAKVDIILKPQFNTKYDWLVSCLRDTAHVTHVFLGLNLAQTIGPKHMETPRVCTTQKLC